MYAMQVLRTLLKKSLPSVHARRREALLAVVKAAAFGAPIAITSMGRAVEGGAFIEHKIKRVDRLVGNRRLMRERKAIYGVLTRWLLRGISMPIILVDWSDLSKDRSKQLLRAALPVGGRSLTLYEEIHPLSKLGNRTVQHRFLKTFQGLLPEGVRPILVADSGFRVPFFRQVEKLGWHWVGRIRNRDYVAFAYQPDQWIAAKSLYAKATRKPRSLGPTLWVRSNPLAARLITFYRKPKGRVDQTLRGRRAQARRSRKQAQREREPWLLVTSPSLAGYSAKQIVRYYQTRMQIEEGFRDTKAAYYGLALVKESRITQERYANLVLIAALTSLLLWLIGNMLKGTAVARTLQVNTTKDRSIYSSIFLARIVLQHTAIRIRQSELRNARQGIIDYFESIHVT